MCFSNWKPLNPSYFDNQLLDRTSRKLALVWLWSIKGLPEVLVWAFCHKKVPLMMIQCCEPIFFQCYLSTVGWYKLKVSKSQKQNVKFSHNPKKTNDFFLHFFALASKRGWNKKIKSLVKKNCWFFGVWENLVHILLSIFTDLQSWTGKPKWLVWLRNHLLTCTLKSKLTHIGWENANLEIELLIAHYFGNLKFQP